MDVLVVESKGKVKKLQGFLDKLYGVNAFAVVTTMGHFRGLPDMDGQAFGDVVDLATFEERHVVHKVDVRTRIAGVARGARTIFLATDADREGEAIAWHVLQDLKLDPRRARRVRFTEITESALKTAIENATDIDMDLVDAQRGRQVLDYEMGLELSRRLWRFGAKSAGRVQSAAVRIVVDRENAIRGFKAVSYVTVQAHYIEGFDAVLKTDKTQAAADGVDDDGLEEESDEAEAEASRLVIRRFLDPREAKAVADIARTRPHVVESVERKPVSRRPKPPFMTATLQAAAAAELGFDAKKTARVAQELFEKGLITYIRTDSTALAEEALEDIRTELRKRFPLLVPSEPQRFADKKGTQGAHEAIRPVHMENAEAGQLEGEARALYELVWWRTLACQASNARFDKTTVTIRVDGIDSDRFVAEAQVTIKPGFLGVERAARGTPKKGLGDGVKEFGLPAQLARGTRLNVKNIDERGGTTTPPSRFTEATLTLYLKKRGIGRPATYTSTLATIVDRGYVRKVKSRLEPTDHGVMADTLLRSGFDTLTKEEFTASCERNLDGIAEGKISRVAFLKKFHDGFSKLLEQAQPKLAAFAAANPTLDRDAVIVDGQRCSKCNGVRHVRSGKNGRVAICQSDDCRDIQLVDAKVLSKSCCHRDEAHGKMARIAFEKAGKKSVFFKCLVCAYSSSTEERSPPCPLCRSPMRKLESARGAFWGCSAFREAGCRGSAPYEAPAAERRRAAPGAGGRQRADKRGRRGHKELSA